MINCVFSLYVSILKEYIVFFYTLEDLKWNMCKKGLKPDL